MKDRERLFESVEKIRGTDFPDLSPDLVRDVLATQIRLQEDRVEARRRTHQVVSQWAAEHSGDATEAEG